MNTLKLSDASRRLRMPYQSLYYAVASGRIAAHRDETGSRWLIAEADLPRIAEELEITPAPSAASLEVN